MESQEILTKQIGDVSVGKGEEEKHDEGMHEDSLDKWMIIVLEWGVAGANGE